MNLVIIQSEFNLLNKIDFRTTNIGSLLIKNNFFVNNEKINNVFIVQLGSEFSKDVLLTENYGNISFYNFECSSPTSIQNLLLLSPYLRKESIVLVIDDINLQKYKLDKYIEYSNSHADVDGIIAIKRNENEDKEICISIDETGNIRNFSHSKDLYNWSTASLYFFQPTLFNNIEWALDLGISKLNSFLVFLTTQNRILKVYPIE